MPYSIVDEQTGEAVAAEVVLLRAAANKTCLVVEGGSDYKLFYHFVHHDSCDIVIAGGKENSLKAMEAINTRGILGVLAVVDGDYDELLSKNQYSINVIATSDHDMESMLLQSPSLDRVFLEMGSVDKAKLRRDAGGDLRDDLITAAYPLGVARLFSIKYNLNIKFDGFKFKYLSKKLEYEIEDLFSEIRNHSQMPWLSSVDYISELEFWRNTDHDRWKMCCGHDLCHILGIALQSLWGSRNAKEVEPEGLESRLRLGFDGESFRNTKLYDCIRNWEFANHDYRLLRD